MTGAIDLLGATLRSPAAESPHSFWRDVGLAEGISVAVAETVETCLGCFGSDTGEETIASVSADAFRTRLRASFGSDVRSALRISLFPMAERRSAGTFTRRK